MRASLEIIWKITTARKSELYAFCAVFPISREARKRGFKMVQSRRQVKEAHRKRKKRNPMGLVVERERIYKSGNYYFSLNCVLDPKNGAVDYSVKGTDRQGRKQGKEDYVAFLARNETTIYKREASKLSIRILNTKPIRDRIERFAYRNQSVMFNGVRYSKGFKLRNCLPIEKQYLFEVWISISGIENEEQFKELIGLDGIKEHNL